MKTNNKLFLKYNEKQHQQIIDSILENSQTYQKAAKELLNLDVKGYTAENLVNGGFLTIFHEYQKAEHSKPEWAKLKITYEKYLYLRELDTSKLEDLEKKHNDLKDAEYRFYDFNDSIFKQAEHSTNTENINLMKYAPKKTSYTIVDFLSFRGNKAIINVPKQPFEIYAINTSQVDLLQDITDLVNSARKLKATHKDVKALVNKYISHNGLSYDLKSIDFNFNAVLMQRL